MRIPLLLLCTLACRFPETVGQDRSTPADSTPLVELTEENFTAWRDHLSPTAKDVAFEAIPWLASLAEGVVAADQQQKPLLLWMMNGHPLGCT